MPEDNLPINRGEAAPISNRMKLPVLSRRQKKTTRGENAAKAVFLLLAMLFCLLCSGCGNKNSSGGGQVPSSSDVAALLTAPFQAQCQVSYAATTAEIALSQDVNQTLRMEVTAPEELAGFSISADDQGAHLAFRDIEINLETLPEGMVNAFTLFHTVREKIGADGELPAFTADGESGLYVLPLSEDPPVSLYTDEKGIPARIECVYGDQEIAVTVESFTPGEAQ